MIKLPENPYLLNDPFPSSTKGFTHGSLATLKAVYEWLNETCPHCLEDFKGQVCTQYKRHACDTCMTEFKKFMEEK